MWALSLVLLSVRFDHEACLVEATEPVLVQAAVAELPVEALDKRVLSGLAWLDEEDPNVMERSPVRKRSARELWAIIDHNGFWLSACKPQPVECASDVFASNRAIDMDDGRFSCAVIDDR